MLVEIAEPEAVVVTWIRLLLPWTATPTSAIDKLPIWYVVSCRESSAQLSRELYERSPNRVNDPFEVGGLDLVIEVADGLRPLHDGSIHVADEVGSTRNAHANAPPCSAAHDGRDGADTVCDPDLLLHHLLGEVGYERLADALAGVVHPRVHPVDEQGSVKNPVRRDLIGGLVTLELLACPRPEVVTAALATENQASSQEVTEVIRAVKRSVGDLIEELATGCHSSQATSDGRAVSAGAAHVSTVRALPRVSLTGQCVPMSRGRWARFRAWANRLDNSAALTDFKPQGIDLAAEPVRSQIIEAAWSRRFGLRNAVVVEDGEFVARADANARLPDLAADVQVLATHGILQYAFRASDGAEGVTVTSLERELEWRRTASRWQRAKRGVRGALNYM